MASLKKLTGKVQIVARAGEVKKAWDKRDEWQQKAHGYRCTLIYERRRYTFDFWQGSAHTKPPAAGEALECLLSDASSGDQDFEQFCGDLGYDTDSIKARDTWKGCQRATKAMKRLLGDDYEAFLYADRD